MTLSRKTNAAIDLFIATAAEFREQLALVDHAMGTAIDCAAELQKTGRLSNELSKRMNETTKAINELAQAAEALQRIDLAIKIIEAEIGPKQ